MQNILFHLVWVRLGDVRDGLAPTQVFNAVPSSSHSEPAKLAPLFLYVAKNFHVPFYDLVISSSLLSLRAESLSWLYR